MRFEMSREAVERFIDQSIVGDARRPSQETRKPSRTLAVVGKKAVDIRAEHAAVGRHRAFGRAVGKLGKGSRAVWPFFRLSVMPRMWICAGLPLQFIIAAGSR